MLALTRNKFIERAEGSGIAIPTWMREIIIPQKTGPYPDPKSFKFYEVTIADNGLGNSKKGSSRLDLSTRYSTS